MLSAPSRSYPLFRPRKEDLSEPEPASPLPPPPADFAPEPEPVGAPPDVERVDAKSDASLEEIARKAMTRRLQRVAAST